MFLPFLIATWVRSATNNLSVQNAANVNVTVVGNRIIRSYTPTAIVVLTKNNNVVIEKQRHTIVFIFLLVLGQGVFSYIIGIYKLKLKPNRNRSKDLLRKNTSIYFKNLSNIFVFAFAFCIVDQIDIHKTFTATDIQI